MERLVKKRCLVAHLITGADTPDTDKVEESAVARVQGTDSPLAQLVRALH